MKEFEALKRIETTFNLNKQNRPSVYNDYTNSVEPYYRDYDLVEKAVTALEIIIKKKVDTAKLRLCFMLFDIEKDEEEMNVERCAYYNNGQCVEDKLSLVEFKMLKEVFEE